MRSIPISYRTLGVVVLSLIWALALALDVWPVLRGAHGWRWPFVPLDDLKRLLPLLLVVAAYLMGVKLFFKRRIGFLLAWTMIGTTLMTIAALAVRYDPWFQLYTMTLSPNTSGWHYAAAHVNDLNAALHDWPKVMQDFNGLSSHMSLSPPGMVVGYSIINQMLERVPALADALGRPLRAAVCQNFNVVNYTNAEFASAWVGMLMPIWGALTVLPLYGLGKQLFDDHTARWTVILWPLVPGLLMFAPLPNIFYPLPAVIVIWLFITGLRRDKFVLILLAGVLTSCLTYMNFTFVPLLLMVGALLIGLPLLHTEAAEKTNFWQRLPWRYILKMGLWYGIGLAAIWAVAYFATGTSLLPILQTAMTTHLDLHRPYLPWLVLHPNDFFMFIGWPVSLMALIGIGLIVVKLWKKKPVLEADVFLLALASASLLLDFSGTMRGESGRVLLFMVPFWLLAAGSVIGAETSAGQRWSGPAVVAAQVVVMIALVGLLRVVDASFTMSPAPPQLATASPDTAVPANAVFGDVLHLTAFAGHGEISQGPATPPSAKLILWLDWTSTGQVDVPYYLSFVPVSPTGNSESQATLIQPFKRRYPTTCWLPQSGPLHDRIEIPVSEAADGDWWVSLSLVNGITGEKLSVLYPDGSRDDQVGLGPFHVTATQDSNRP